MPVNPDHHAGIYAKYNNTGNQVQRDINHVAQQLIHIAGEARNQIALVKLVVDGEGQNHDPSQQFPAHTVNKA